MKWYKKVLFDVSFIAKYKCSVFLVYFSFNSINYFVTSSLQYVRDMCSKLKRHYLLCSYKTVDPASHLIYLRYIACSAGSIYKICFDYIFSIWFSETVSLHPLSRARDLYLHKTIIIIIIHSVNSRVNLLKSSKVSLQHTTKY